MTRSNQTRHVSRRRPRKGKPSLHAIAARIIAGEDVPPQHIKLLAADYLTQTEFAADERDMHRTTFAHLRGRLHMLVDKLHDEQREVVELRAHNEHLFQLLESAAQVQDRMLHG